MHKHFKGYPNINYISCTWKLVLFRLASKALPVFGKRLRECNYTQCQDLLKLLQPAGATWNLQRLICLSFLILGFRCSWDLGKTSHYSMLLQSGIAYGKDKVTTTLVHPSPNSVLPGSKCRLHAELHTQMVSVTYECFWATMLPFRGQTSPSFCPNPWQIFSYSCRWSAFLGFQTSVPALEFVCHLELHCFELKHKQLKGY